VFENKKKLVKKLNSKSDSGSSSDAGDNSEFEKTCKELIL
jgi:hypothetical protein